MARLKVVTAEQMQRIDKRAIEEFLIPSIVLMENASLAVMEVVSRDFPDAQRVAVFCGTGLNGGDGLALARHLVNGDIAVDIILLGESEACKGDAGTNLQICTRIGIPIHFARDDESLDKALEIASAADLVVDAIFGTGLSRTPAGLHARSIEAINGMRAPVIAIDIPSGLNASSSDLREPAVSADVTVTFVAPKICHIFEPAAGKCGDVVVADISIPSAAVDREEIALSLMGPRDAGLILGTRARESHKGTYGHVAIVAGSPGRSGAAILAARGALRAGAGLITVVTDHQSAQIVDSVSIESMSLVADITAGSVDLAAIIDHINGKTSAAVIGPGLADDEKSYEAVRTLVQQIDRPLVIDASALNAFVSRGNELNAHGHQRVITPHPGELARLMNISVADIQSNRMAVAREAANITKCVVVLKGHQTVVADPEGELAINPTGNPGMATGGMGDVLAGLIAALLARGTSSWDAARAAVYVHGRAGDLLSEEHGDVGLAAMDLADRIPEAIHGLSL